MLPSTSNAKSGSYSWKPLAVTILKVDPFVKTRGRVYWIQKKLDTTKHKWSQSIGG